MFEHADLVGWLIGILAIFYAVWTEHKSRQRRDLAHAALVALKPSIQGPNKDEVIAAINDLLEKLGK